MVWEGKAREASGRPLTEEKWPIMARGRMRVVAAMINPSTLAKILGGSPAGASD